MLSCNMDRPSRSICQSQFSPTPSIKTISPLLHFRNFASHSFQTTFPLFAKTPGVYPQKANPKRKPFAETQFREPISMLSNHPTLLHRKHSPPVAPSPLSMYIEPRPHLHRSAPGASAFGSA